MRVGPDSAAAAADGTTPRRALALAALTGLAAVLCHRLQQGQPTAWSEAGYRMSLDEEWRRLQVDVESGAGRCWHCLLHLNLRRFIMVVVSYGDSRRQSRMTAPRALRHSARRPSAPARRKASLQRAPPRRPGRVREPRPRQMLCLRSLRRSRCPHQPSRRPRPLWGRRGRPRRPRLNSWCSTRCGGRRTSRTARAPTTRGRDWARALLSLRLCPTPLWFVREIQYGRQSILTVEIDSRSPSSRRGGAGGRSGRRARARRRRKTAARPAFPSSSPFTTWRGL
jgi:hypothetical protein